MSHLKEKVLFYVMAALSLIFYGIGIPLLIINPVLGPFSMLIGLIIAIALLIGSIFMVGMLRGNSIRVDEQQFPEVYNLVKKHAHTLGMKIVPHVYVIQSGGILNIFVKRILRYNHVVFSSNLFDLAYQDGVDVLSFIIAHELGHLKLNHTSSWKRFLTLPAAIFVPFIGKAYSRTCEYNADTVGLSLCPEGAVNGFLILSIGKSLYKRVDVEYALQNFKQNKGFATSFAEFFASHPLLFNRIDRARTVQSKLKKQDLEQTFVSPRVKIAQKEQK